MIAKITRAYVRTYRDNGQVTAYVEWVDHKGAIGRTEAPVRLPNESASTGRKLAEVFGDHMGALMARAICTGVAIDREVW